MSLGSIKPFVPGGSDFAKSKAFFLQDYENKEVQDNLMLYVTVDDLDAWWVTIQESGVLDRYEGARATEPTDFPWGARELHLVDPAGVCWHFA